MFVRCSRGCAMQNPGQIVVDESVIIAGGKNGLPTVLDPTNTTTNTNGR